MSDVFLEQNNKWDLIVKKIMFYKSLISSAIFLFLQILFFSFLALYNKNLNYLYNIIWGVVIFLVYIIIKYIYIQKIFNTYSYSILDEEIIIQSGFFNKNKSYIPYNIIQNVSINKGPIIDKFGYVHIEIKLISFLENIIYVKKENAEIIKRKIIENKNRYKLKF